MSPQLRAAMLRAALTAIPTAVLAALTVWATTDDAKAIIIAGLTALLTPFVVRGAGEGLYDQERAATGTVHPGDVQPLIPAGVPPPAVVSGTGEPPPSARGGVTDGC